VLEVKQNIAENFHKSHHSNSDEDDYEKDYIELEVKQKVAEHFHKSQDRPEENSYKFEAINMDELNDVVFNETP
jgi:hypothetical protein